MPDSAHWLRRSEVVSRQYCSVKAGHAFVTGNYPEAIPYYLAFFGWRKRRQCVAGIQRL